MRIAIEKYTKDGTDDFYYKIRKAQNIQNIEKNQDEKTTDEESLNLINEYKSFIKAIENFIKISPKYKGKIYRGMALESDISEIYSIKGLKTPYGMRGMSSWTTDKEQAIRYASKNSNDQKPIKMILEIENCKTGTSVRHLSKAPVDEKEILVSGYTYFKTIKIKVNIDEDGFYIISVKEM